MQGRQGSRRGRGRQLGQKLRIGGKRREAALALGVGMRHSRGLSRAIYCGIVVPNPSCTP